MPLHVFTTHSSQNVHPLTPSPSSMTSPTMSWPSPTTMTPTTMSMLGGFGVQTDSDIESEMGHRKYHTVDPSRLHSRKSSLKSGRVQKSPKKGSFKTLRSNMHLLHNKVGKIVVRGSAKFKPRIHSTKGMVRLADQKALYVGVDKRAIEKIAEIIPEQTSTNSTASTYDMSVTDPSLDNLPLLVDSLPEDLLPQAANLDPNWLQLVPPAAPDSFLGGTLALPASLDEVFKFNFQDALLAEINTPLFEMENSDWAHVEKRFYP